jgi:trk system potassium uptake protein TrkH
MPLLRLLATAFSYSYYIGLAMIVASLSFLGSAAIFVAFYLAGTYGDAVSGDEFMVAAEFGGWGLIMMLLGLALSRITPPPLTRGSAIVITVVIWLLVPLLSSIPLASALRISVVDALFEAVAGWTTTGLTIMLGAPSSQGGYVPSISELPETVKIWRALIQWEGGVGIVVFTIAFLARPGISAAALYLAEGRYERLEASLRRSAFKMAQVYMVFTVIGVAAMVLAGMDLYDSVLHTMTAISTAGFSTYDESIGAFKGQLPIYAVTLAIAFLGATSFVDLDNIMNLRLRKLLQSPELKAQVALALAAALLAALIWARSPEMRVEYSVADAIYNALSALTTVGYSTASLEPASSAYIVLLIVLSFIGGSAFSTAGGIKILRLLIVVKAIEIEVKSLVMPRGYVPRRRLGSFKLRTMSSTM